MIDGFDTQLRIENRNPVSRTNESFPGREAGKFPRKFFDDDPRYWQPSQRLNEGQQPPLVQDQITSEQTRATQRNAIQSDPRRYMKDDGKTATDENGSHFLGPKLSEWRFFFQHHGLRKVRQSGS